jgi:Putative adipose-regulatory protein (Seipin)
MLDLSLISPESAAHLATPSERDILAHSRRPAILTYMSPLLNTVDTIAGAPLLLLGFKKEAEMLDVRMMEGVEFVRGWRNVPKSLRLEVQADEKMQVYSAKVKFVARFAGLRHAPPNSAETYHARTGPQLTFAQTQMDNVQPPHNLLRNRNNPLLVHRTPLHRHCLVLPLILSSTTKDPHQNIPFNRTPRR